MKVKGIVIQEIDINDQEARLVAKNFILDIFGLSEYELNNLSVDKSGRLLKYNRYWEKYTIVRIATLYDKMLLEAYRAVDRYAIVNYNYETGALDKNE